MPSFWLINCQVHFAEVLINKLSGRPCRGWPWTGVTCTSQNWGQAVCRLCVRRRNIHTVWFLKKYFHISSQGSIYKLPWNSDVHLARESNGTLFLVSRLISSGLGAAPPTWVHVVKVWSSFFVHFALRNASGSNCLSGLTTCWRAHPKYVCKCQQCGTEGKTWMIR